MALFYALGTALVNQEELRIKQAEGTVLAAAGFAPAQTPRVVEFMNGVATADDFLPKFEFKGTRLPFEPIGIGKPLTVQLRHVYTGDKAHGFWGDRDMLVTSAVKSVATFGAAPRAVNFLERQSRNNQNFRCVPASGAGTPLVYYSLSLVQSSSVVTTEVVFDGFPDGVFDVVLRAFSAAASVPVFVPAAGYLAVAGLVTRLVADIGEAIEGGTPALKQTEEISFDIPGSPTGRPGFYLLIADAVRPSILNDYMVSDEGQLVKTSDRNALYDGPCPYAVLSVDGREHRDFEEFTPTAVTAAMLDKFYNVREGGSQVVGWLTDAMRLYNDMSFRAKAMQILDRLDRIPDHTSAEYRGLKALYDAYVKNIGEKLLKPKAE
jgi:hypothetical protein